MTAVLAAIARAVLGAVLVLAAVASVFWVAFGPQGLWAVMFAVVTGAVLGVAALAPRKGDGDG